MGHLINPISFRLGINSSWNSNWSLINNFNYINIFKKDYRIYTYLDKYIKKKEILFKHSIIITKYKLYHLDNKFYINFNYYIPHYEETRYHIYGKKYLRAIWLKRKYVFLGKRKTKISRIKWKLNSRIWNKRYKRKFNLIRQFIFYNYKYYSVYLFILSWNYHLNFFFTKIYNRKIIYYFNVFGTTFSNVGPDLITIYISARLQQQYSLKFVLKPVFRDLNRRLRRGNFLGYKLLCGGRFTRNQIATYTWWKQGSLNLSTIRSTVKYSQSKVRLKFGLGGIKLWINYGINKVKTKMWKHYRTPFFISYPFYFPLKFYLIKNKIIFFFNYWSFMFLRISYIKRGGKFTYLHCISVILNKIIFHIYKKKCNKSLLHLCNLKILNNNKIILWLNNIQFIKNKKLLTKFYE